MIILNFRSLEKSNPSFHNFTTLGGGGYKGISKTGSNEQYLYAPRLILFRLYQQKVKSRIKESLKLWHWFRHTTQKMEFFIKDCFSKCDQIHSFLLPHLLTKSLMKNFILVQWHFCRYTKIQRRPHLNMNTILSQEETVSPTVFSFPFSYAPREWSKLNEPIEMFETYLTLMK